MQSIQDKNRIRADHVPLFLATILKAIQCDNLPRSIYVALGILSNLQVISSTQEVISSTQEVTGRYNAISQRGPEHPRSVASMGVSGTNHLQVPRDDWGQSQPFLELGWSRFGQD